MKRLILLLLASCAILSSAVACYDDSALRDEISDIKERLDALETSANKGISDLWEVVNALDHKVTILSVTETDDAWAISLSNGKTVTISKQANGQSPVIGVRKDSDGVWYWTLDGEWMLDGGNKVPVSGSDVTALKLKIEGDSWYISYDGGATWNVIESDTGTGGSFFTDVSVDDCYVYLTLQDGTVIKLSRGAGCVKAISVVPEVEDGGVLAVLNDFVVCFDVLPATAAESVAELDLSCFKVKLVYTQTKVKVEDDIDLPVKKVEARDGRIGVTVDGSSIKPIFAVGWISANVSLSIDDGTNAVTSGYFPIHYDVARISRLIEKQWLNEEKNAILDIGWSFPRRFFWWDNTVPEGGNPYDQFGGQYYFCQYPDGAILIASGINDYYFVFRNVTESTAEYAIHYNYDEDGYPNEDDYGWYSQWTKLVTNPHPQEFTWGSWALDIGGKLFSVTEALGYGQPSYKDALLHGMEQAFPMVRMNNCGSEEDFHKVDVAGKVAVVDRGENYFYEKLTNGWKAGAIAVVCVNNSYGTLSPNLTGITSDVNIPFITITREAGRRLNGHTSISFVYCNDPNEIVE